MLGLKYWAFIQTLYFGLQDIGFIDTTLKMSIELKSIFINRQIGIQWIED